MSQEITQLTLRSYLDLLAAKKISTPEVYDSFVTQSEKLNDDLNVYLSLNNQAADQAQQQTKNPLAGAPLAIKDNFCTKDLVTTASSKVLENFVPQFESTATQRLKDAGGVTFGKTNLDAWAHGSSTETSDFGPTKNPRNTDYLPGGSSGGSAAAVAADMCIAALGSETAGSIRLPAQWCGVVGLKPTYGRVSRYGAAAMASSTDSPGPITKTVEDAALMLQQLAGHDPLDGTTSREPVPNYSAALNQDIKGMKIGVIYLDLPGMETIKPILEKELQVFEELGAKVELVDALDPKYAMSVYTIVQRGEVSSNLARYTGVRYGENRSLLGAEAKRRIMLGTYTLSKGYADQYYVTAQKVRTLFRQDFDRLFEKYDVLISAVSPGYAQKSGSSENSAMHGELTDMLNEPSSITGLPGISVPCYRDPATNLYLGFNIMAPMWQESRLITVGHAYELATSWNSWRSDAK